MSPAVTVWHLTANTLVYAPVSGEAAVIYHTPSGDTHLVNALSAQIISLLGNAAASSDVLLAQIAVHSPAPLEQEFPQVLESTLADLHRLDLITETSV